MINVDGSDDHFYRYKMEELSIKLEGSRNGKKTIITNILNICKSIKIEENILTRFFGLELGTQSEFINKRNILMIDGFFNKDKLQIILLKFIKTHILCKKCSLPEIELFLKKNNVFYHCKACGAYDIHIHNDIKFENFLKKNLSSIDPYIKKNNDIILEYKYEEIKNIFKYYFEIKDKLQRIKDEYNLKDTVLYLSKNYLTQRINKIIEEDNIKTNDIIAIIINSFSKDIFIDLEKYKNILKSLYKKSNENEIEILIIKEIIKLILKYEFEKNTILKIFYELYNNIDILNEKSIINWYNKYNNCTDYELICKSLKPFIDFLLKDDSSNDDSDNDNSNKVSDISDNSDLNDDYRKAICAYEIFFKLPFETCTIDQLNSSSAGYIGFLKFYEERLKLFEGKMADYYKKSEIKLTHYIKNININFKFIGALDDGMCLYHSLEIILKYNWKDIRTNAINYYIDNWESIDKLSFNYDNKRNTMNKFKKYYEKEWGDIIMINGIEKYYNINIIIIFWDSINDNIYLLNNNHIDDDLNIYYLLNRDNTHYDALIL